MWETGIGFLILVIALSFWGGIFGRNQVYYGVMSSIELGRLPAPIEQPKSLFQVTDFDRNPKAGTDIHRVLSLVRDGCNRREIRDRLGWSVKKVGTAIRNLYRGGYVRKPTLEETKEAFRQSRSRIDPAIKPFLELGMSSHEIHIALEMFGITEFSVRQISDHIMQLKDKGFLPGPTSEEKKDKLRIVREKREKTKARITKWFYLRDWFLENHKEEEMPKKRLEWRKLLEEKKAEKVLLGNVRKSAEGYSFADFETFASSILPKKDLSDEDKLFLETYYYARIRRAYDANAGNFEGLGNQQMQKLKDFHTESEKSIFERLSPHIKLIQANTATIVDIRMGIFSR